MKRNIKNRIWNSLKSVLGRHNYERLRMRYNLGYWPHLKNPRTLNEHIAHKKLFTDMDFAVQLADKYAVREYIANKVGEEYLPKNHYVGENLDNVNWDEMPDQFVIKTTHGGGDEGNVFVYDKSKMNLAEVTEKTNANLGKRFGSWTNEDWYLKIQPRVMIEGLMLDHEGEVPTDYKFFCFSGKVHFIQVNSARYTGHRRSFYSTDWELLSFRMGNIPTTKLPKPEALNDMVAIAEKLSEDFDLIRVDLYSIPEGIRFGELTFTPGGGHEVLYPSETDWKYGDLLQNAAKKSA